ncbi:sensor histidine kinase [uncultured Amnibacterium sp.]|uniref:sensor histidine kinase n=1 Tax=uncultured Amnibacterium sp. TaxID=1631851 RepID=UPI0035C9AB6F
MRTPSLRRRVVLWSVGVLTLLLLVVGIGVDLVLGTALRADQRDRLQSVAALASQLTGVTDQSLADRLSMPGIEAHVVYASGAETVVGVPEAPPRGHRGPPAPRTASTDATITVVSEGGRLVATQTLRPGVRLQLTTDSTQIDAILLRFRVIMAGASAGAVLLAALLLPLVLRRAMRPLAALTRAAQETAAGGRGRRLEPQQPGTDLGSAAAQFDAMLEELEGAEARAAASADRLGRFLSDASHELRTPLAGVSAGAERLIRDPLGDEERDRVVISIVREARRAGRLVDDLLLVSRLGEIRVHPLPRSVRAIVDDAAERAGQQRRPLEITTAGPDALLDVDRQRLDQVLANLIGNARNAGARRLVIRTVLTAGEVHLRVSDDGPGIAAECRELVFERLVRLDPARSAASGGAGLGLPIARGLVEAHGGTLRCVAPADGDLPGAVLVLRLPRPAVAQPAAVDPSPAAAHA